MSSLVKQQIKHHQTPTMNLTHQITEIQQQLVALQRQANVSAHQLARNQFSMTRLIMAAFALRNPRRMICEYGMTTKEIFSFITDNMGQRATMGSVNQNIQILKCRGKLDGIYCRDWSEDLPIEHKIHGNTYIWYVPTEV